MVNSPRSTEEIYFSIRNELTSRISKLSNFVEGSFNNAFLAATSDQVREAEIKATAAELAGTVDYAGKQLTQSDLDRLDIDSIEPEQINKYMSDDHLDYLAANFSIQRFEGERSSGIVTIEISSEDIEIIDGMEVGTQPDSRGRYNRYLVDLPDGQDSITSDNSTEIEVPIVAEEEGPEFNSGPGTITYIPNPSPGVQSVTNNEPITGGEERQSNDSLRDDIKASLFDRSGGGTRSGIVGYIEENTEEDVMVGEVDEFLHNSPPFADVIVDGGDDEYVKELIDESKPTGILHNLVRPTEVGIGSFINVVGDSLEKEDIRNQFLISIDRLNIGESVYASSISRHIMNSNQNIITIPSINIYIDYIKNDRVEFKENKDVYKLEYNPIGLVVNESHYVSSDDSEFATKFSDIKEYSVSIQAVVNDSEVNIDSTNFDVIDTSGDGNLDTIVIDDSVGIDENTIISIDYEHNSGSFTKIKSIDGTIYEKGVDYELIDSNNNGLYDSIDWSVGGDSPEIGDRFEMEYEPRRSVTGDLVIDKNELPVSLEEEVDVKLEN